uniref:PqqA peptide cyclase n=1 Tax=Candidatus Methanophaga sp. ANME-1 ERB7 TaxID=2759913 RepID=A0A7G9Z4C3_9EURY|nr:hypothetical protein MNNOGLJF_00021 [Methanosarcinales archaeon ANME-1 ERB7]
MGDMIRYKHWMKILKPSVTEALTSNEQVLHLKNNFLSRKNIEFPQFIGLMLSRVCDANCIFCPIWKVSSYSERKFMPLQGVKKVAEELSERNYCGVINLGENGDALLNPDFKEIVKLLNDYVPNASIILYTSAKYLDEQTSHFLLDHGLSHLTLNIDGASKTTYEFSKRGCNFEKVRENLKNFIKIRNSSESNCRITIWILPPKRYVEVRKGKRINISYDADGIINYWSKYLSRKDTINEVIYFYNWMSRPQKIKRDKSCPLIWEILEKCFISTEGNAYFCCLDYTTKLVYGNILESSIYILWNGKKRREIISKIIQKKFDDVGEPCLHCNEKNDYLRCYLNYLKYATRVDVGQTAKQYPLY